MAGTSESHSEHPTDCEDRMVRSWSTRQPSSGSGSRGKSSTWTSPMCARSNIAVDRGQWILGAETLLEQAPPFASFSRHVPPEFGETPHSRLLDSRWVESMMHRVKELDDYAERRTKLGRRNLDAGKGNDKDKETEKDRKKPGGGGKGKKGGSSASTEEAAKEK